jgi:uncharacterized protein (UPF0548 family)
MIAWDITDLNTGGVLHARTEEGRDCFHRAIQLLGHWAMVREVEVNA